MLRTRTYISGKKSLIVRLLAVALVFSCLTISAPCTFAAEVETTNELHKGCLFLKANVPDDFYHIVCVKLKDKATEKDLTLKVEGGTVFEVFIKLPDGEYEVVSAYVENSDQYTVGCDANEITCSAESNPSILLDVQPKPEENDSSPDPISSVPASNDTDIESHVDNQDLTSQENLVTAPSDDVDEAVVTELLDNEDGGEDKENDSSDSSSDTMVDICLSILTAVIFFALIAFIVYVVRNKIEE